MDNHLTPNEIETYNDQELADAARQIIERHLAGCAQCHTRVARALRLDAALRTLPVTPPPPDLAARISTAAAVQLAQEQARRERMLFIAAAMFFSVLLALWFATEMVLALQENGAFEFFTLFTSYPDLLSTYTSDAVLAFIETLPISEIVLTLLALITVAVLAQQFVATTLPRPAHSK